NGRPVEGLPPRMSNDHYQIRALPRPARAEGERGTRWTGPWRAHERRDEQHRAEVHDRRSAERPNCRQPPKRVQVDAQDDPHELQPGERPGRGAYDDVE